MKSTRVCGLERNRQETRRHISLFSRTRAHTVNNKNTGNITERKKKKIQNRGGKQQQAREHNTFSTTPLRESFISSVSLVCPRFSRGRRSSTAGRGAGCRTSAALPAAKKKGKGRQAAKSRAKHSGWSLPSSFLKCLRRISFLSHSGFPLASRYRSLCFVEKKMSARLRAHWEGEAVVLACVRMCAGLSPGLLT